MALYVKFAQEKRPRTIRGFIKQFYTSGVDPYFARGHNTYFDPGCTDLHCSRAYRSFDDLWELVNTYYRPIPPAKMMHYLLTTKIPLQGDKIAEVHLGTCSGMRRIRFIPYHSAAFEGIDRQMEFSQFTWRELLAPLGVTNYAEFNEYIKNKK